MPKDIKLTVFSDTGEVFKDQSCCGINGENLQGSIIVEFKRGFVDGTAYLEIDRGKDENGNPDKGFLKMDKVGEAYQLPIKSSLLCKSCIINFQIRITQEGAGVETPPVFKSRIFELKCREAINAIESIPEQYPTWKDSVDKDIADLKGRVGKIEENALPDYDTLKEVGEWINKHGNEAVELNKKVEELEESAISEEQVRELITEETKDFAMKEELQEGLQEQTKDLTSVTVGGEVQKTFNADTKADKSLVNDLKAQVDINSKLLMQSGLAYKADTVDAYTERQTAEGLNILDGQKSILKKVEGNTVACQNLFKFDELVGDNINYITPNINYEKESIHFPTEQNLYIVGISFEENAFDKFNKVLNITEAGVYCLRVKVTDLNGNPLQNAKMRAAWVLNASGSLHNIESSYDANINGLYYFAKFNITQEKLDFIKSTENNVFRLFMYVACDKTTLANIDCIVSEFTFCKGDYTLETMPKYQPIFTGLKSATFCGIESRSQDGAKVDTFTFPKTETPLGTTIDFERQVIIRTTENGVIETPFTAEQKASGNEITAYLKGTEKVLNDNAEYGADNTLTQNYLFVTGVKQ